MRSSTIAVMATLLLLVGCGDDEAGAVEAGDAGASSDAGAADAASPTDAGEEVEDDAAADVLDLLDAADDPDATDDPDAAQPWPANRPRGQCVAHADCPSGSCSQRAPGGICLGVPCPDGLEANFGGCNERCDDLRDCPVGLHCARGLCLNPRCEDDADCEGPMVCADGLCARPHCEGGCPAPMQCSGTYCTGP